MTIIGQFGNFINALNWRTNNDRAKHLFADNLHIRRDTCNNGGLKEAAFITGAAYDIDGGVTQLR